MCQIYRSTNTAATTATVNISIAVAEPLLTTSWQGVPEQITLLVPRRRQRPLLLTESFLVSFSGVRVGTLCVRAYVLERVLVLGSVLCVCVRMCSSACLCACVRACVRACVCVCVCVSGLSVYDLFHDKSSTTTTTTTAVADDTNVCALLHRSRPVILSLIRAFMDLH